MIDFYIGRIFVTIWHWTMFYHDWFSYWDNICQYVTLDNGWKCFTMVDFHIETIFITMRHWTMVDHGWSSLPQCDIRPRDNISHNVTMFIYHDLPWFTMVYFHIETIFLTMQHWNMVNHVWFSYWDNHCHNVTLVDFPIEKIFVTMCHWTMVANDYKPNRLILNLIINTINPMNNIIQ